MIAHINGKLILKTSGYVVIDVGGIGYEVFIPLSTYYKLPGLNETVALKTHTFIKDDSIQLYGFLSHKERELFQMLIGVMGIGPKLARNILSGMSPDALVSSIAGGDLVNLKTLPGVGKKTAERLILELKDSVRAMAEFKSGEAVLSGLHNDVISALNNLGYKPAQAKEALNMARADSSDGAGFEELFKAALKVLS
jgi:Holliday junction DNA helicase RuvA